MSILGACPYALKEKEELLLNRIIVAKVLPISLKYSSVVSVCCSSLDDSSVEKYWKNNQ